MVTEQPSPPHAEATKIQLFLPIYRNELEQARQFIFRVLSHVLVSVLSLHKAKTTHIHFPLLTNGCRSLLQEPPQIVVYAARLRLLVSQYVQRAISSMAADGEVSCRTVELPER